MDKKRIVKYIGLSALVMGAFGLGFSVLHEFVKADYEVKASNTLVSGDPDLSAYYGTTVSFSSTSDIPGYIVSDESDPVEDVPVSELAWYCTGIDESNVGTWVLRYYDSDSNYYNVSVDQVFVYAVADSWDGNYDSIRYVDGVITVVDENQIFAVSVYVNNQYQEGYSSAVADLTETDFVQDHIYTGFTRTSGINLSQYYNDYASWLSEYNGTDNAINYCAGFNNGYDLDYITRPVSIVSDTNTTYGLALYNSVRGTYHLVDGVSFDSSTSLYSWYNNVTDFSYNLNSSYSWEYFPHSSTSTTYFTSYFTDYYEPQNLVAGAYADGYSDGVDDGFVNGYNAGTSAGYETGYDAGYAEAEDAQPNTINLTSTINSIVNMPFRFVQTAFHIELPLSDGSYFNIGAFILGIFGIVLVFKVAQLVFSVFR